MLTKINWNMVFGAWLFGYALSLLISAPESWLVEIFVALGSLLVSFCFGLLDAWLIDKQF